MVRPRPVVQDLLADLPTDAEAVLTQSMLPPKPKRVKKAQPKARATDAEAEDAPPISKLAESKKSASTSTKRSAEGQPSGSTQSKKARSSSATTSASKKPDVPWAPDLSLEDRPIMASESADDINVGVALSTALLLPNDLERNAKLSEYENYALMLQHSVQAIQHAHSFSIQSFENRQRLVDIKREASSMKREIKSLEAKMKKLEDQAEATTKVQTLALEKAEAAEAVRKVAEAEKREAETIKEWELTAINVNCTSSTDTKRSANDFPNNQATTNPTRPKDSNGFIGWSVLVFGFDTNKLKMKSLQSRDFPKI
ncbi:uncharacterized protein LOC114301323 [Camellia sinensis]|uniref:uncharacterized protein LOC114301323 n=1 Tax=Camellia sinensis TaxID=4442 RepID=UPI00103611A8|nr:uncharacterized protein LOC114301323 [Camellia sinensis]